MSAATAAVGHMATATPLISSKATLELFIGGVPYIGNPSIGCRTGV
jgi:hypothetical protein